MRQTYCEVRTESYGSHVRLPSCYSQFTVLGGAMFIKTMRLVVQYFQEGFFSQENNEETLKIYLIYSFSLIGFIFVSGFGLRDIHASNMVLTTFLLSGSLILLLNLFYLKKTENYVFSGYIVLYFFFALMLYLVYSGGVENTGSLWIYCLPAIALYIHGLQRGLLDLSIFLFAMTFILFYPDNNLLEATYSVAFKVRIILSFLVVVFLSAVYGYSREKSAWKMTKMRKDLEFFLRRDELTGLYNRRGYQDNINKIEDTYGSILMCDIDHFKKVNDTYGHAIGDFTIKEVSKCIRNNLRKQDVAVRWGGEEFFIFLSETTLENAYLVSEKLRESIENLAIRYSDEIIIRVTLSIGVSKVNANISLEEAIRHADDAMYLSKTAGRNKSTTHNL